MLWVLVDFTIAFNAVLYLARTTFWCLVMQVIVEGNPGGLHCVCL